MPLLDARNTDFATAVTRSGAHWKSGRLGRLETALRDVQDHPADAVKLRYLYKRLYRWIEENSAEFRNRGALVGQLAYQIEQRAAQLRTPVHLEAQQFRRVTAAASLWTPLRDLRVAINAHSAVWSTIEITDRPTAVHGQYTFTAGNAFSEGDRNVAITDTHGGAHVELNREYWLRLGRRVITPQADGHCYGRCFSCAAAVIYTLVTDLQFDSYIIEHIGARDYDHHLVLVGRSNANGVNEDGLMAQREQWKWTAIVIDVWQANLNNDQNFACLTPQNQYALGNLRWFCAYTPANRAADRIFAQGLALPVRAVAVRMDITAQARAAVQSQGRATRTVRGPDRQDGRRTWIVEEEITPNVWQRVD